MSEIMDNDRHRLVIARGKSNLGKATTKNINWGSLRALLDDVYEDKTYTRAEYERLDKNKQNERKALPGFILGGKCEDGKRSNSSIPYRTLVALDVDDLTPNQFQRFLDQEGNIWRFEFYWHETRRSTPEAPRIRIFLPLKDRLGHHAFHALSRVLGTMLLEDPQESISLVDVVSFRQAQLMFLPSASKGQKIKSGHNPGKIIPGEKLLSQWADKTGIDWKDHSQLPRDPERENKAPTDPDQKSEDPFDKDGIVGDFCRAYPIEEAIAEFLSEEYVESDQPSEMPRYTYTGGGGSNGAVVYGEGRWLFSHHGTDPCSEMLVNSFDLVRLHKFKHLDEDAHGGTATTNLPSWKAMVKLASADERVRAEKFAGMAEEFEDDEDESDREVDDAPLPVQGEGLTGDEIAKAQRDAEEDAKFNLDTFKGGVGADDFQVEDEGDTEIADMLGLDEPPTAKKKKEKEDTSWTAKLREKANGEIMPVQHNANLICANNHRIAKKIAYNDFTHERVALGEVRAKKIDTNPDPILPKQKRTGRKWTDNDTLCVKSICSAPLDLGGFAVDFADTTLEGALHQAARKNRFHPVRERMEECHRLYLESGKATKGAIEQIPQTYLGCPDTPFHRESSRMYLVAMVARIFDPGCKFDNVPIIRGKQGGGKSTFWRVLSGGWFTELSKDFENTGRMIESMQGNLICEMGEMAGLRRETADAAKAFITAQVDSFRLAYARNVQDFPRQSVLCGTTNNEKMLHDPTGNRRFWIWADCHDEDNKIDNTALREALPMVWGEAVDEYLKMRKQQPRGDLHLDLVSKEARDERDALAEGAREKTATEIIAEEIETFLETPLPASEAILDSNGFPVDEDDERLVVRNVVALGDVFEAVKQTAVGRSYPRATLETYSRAMALLEPRWVSLGRCRRLGRRERWFARDGETKQCREWAEADAPGEDPEVDEMLC